MNSIKQIIAKLKEEDVIGSRKEFAELIDYTPSSLSNMINGYSHVNQDIIKRMKAVFNVNPVYVKMGQGSMFIDNKIINPKENELFKNKNFIENFFEVVITGDIPLDKELEKTVSEFAKKLEKFLS